MPLQVASGMTEIRPCDIDTDHKGLILSILVARVLSSILLGSFVVLHGYLTCYGVEMTDLSEAFQKSEGLCLQHTTKS